MNALAQIEPFAVFTTLMWGGIAIFGLVMCRISMKPLKRKEQDRREDEAYQRGFRRGFRQGLQSEPQSIANLTKPKDP